MVNPAIRLSIPEIDPDESALTWALAYAKCGWYVVPIAAGTKHPGSVLGKQWHHQSSRDSEVIVSWFAGTDYGIALHAGRSGAVIFDVDYPEKTPELLTEAFKLPHPIQTTRDGAPGRGHHLFTQPAGRNIGNSLGNLPHGFGEVRGANGVIIVAPSVHPDPDGHYQWQQYGPVPELPAPVASALSDAAISSDVASDAVIVKFFTEHVANERPALLTAVLQRYALESSEGSRHEACVRAMTWAMREARLGYFPAIEAARKIGEAHAAMVGTDRPVGAELAGVRAWAVSQALGDDLGARRESSAARVGTSAQSAAERLTSMVSKPTTAPPAPVAPAGASGSSGALALLVGPADPVEEEPDAASALDALTTQLDGDDSAPSWQAVDLSAFLDGTHEEIVPTLLMRADGQHLLYRGKVHSFHGESESGKSWIGQIECANVLNAGGRAVFIDYESDPATVVSRLRLLGVAPGLLRPGGRFQYVKPERAPWSPSEAASWAALLASAVDLIVLDGVTEALTTMAVKSNDNDELTAWTRQVPRKLARETGAAVVMVDHVVKNREDGGRFAIGGQAKMATLDGAAFVVEMTKPLGLGLVGEITMRLAKDRNAMLRGAAGAYRKSDRTQEIARITIDSTSREGIEVTINPPASDIHNVPVPTAGAALEGAGFRPTKIMQNLSDEIEKNEGIGTNQLTKLGDHLGGSKETRRKALELLIAEEYVRREASGNRSFSHYTIKPYRMVNDSLSNLIEDSETALSGLVGEEG